MASFMNETCRRTAWPSEAADCSAAAVGLGQAHRHLGHGRGHQFQLLRAPGEQRQEPEQRDRQADGGRRHHHHRAGEERAAGGRDVGGRHGPDQQGADGEPAAGCGRRQLEGAAGGLLLQSEDQAADGGRIVVGGNLGARRTRRPALGGARRAGLGALPGLSLLPLPLAAGLERAEAGRGARWGGRPRCRETAAAASAAPVGLRPRQAPGRARRPRAASFRPEPFPVPISAPRWTPNPLAPTHIPIPGWGTGAQRGKLVIRRRVSGWRGSQSPARRPCRPC